MGKDNIYLFTEAVVKIIMVKYNNIKKSVSANVLRNKETKFRCCSHMQFSIIRSHGIRLQAFD